MIRLLDVFVAPMYLRTRQSQFHISATRARAPNALGDGTCELCADIDGRARKPNISLDCSWKGGLVDGSGCTRGCLEPSAHAIECPVSQCPETIANTSGTFTGIPHGVVKQSSRRAVEPQHKWFDGFCLELLHQLGCRQVDDAPGLGVLDRRRARVLSTRSSSQH